MRRTLVVVDMQIFENGTECCDDRIVELIHRFREVGDPIVVLEYRGSGSTIPPVAAAAEGYVHWAVVEKEYYNGGGEVTEACKANGWPLDFLVCGVSYKCCVEQTANNLAGLYPVEVALDCTDAGGNEWRGGSLVEVTRRFEEAA